MRITQGMIQGRVLADLNRTQNLVADRQREVSTGNRINKPSDDAVGTRDALRRRDDLAAIDSLQTSAQGASGWLETSDAALGQVHDVLQRVRELTVQAKNGTMSAANLQSVAAEVAGLIDSVKDAANARYGDDYVFGGHKSSAPPYAPATGDANQGDTGVVARQIGPGVSVQVNQTAATLFGSGGGDGKLIDVLRTVQAHLNTGNAAALTGDITAIDGQVDVVGAARATLGATGNRVDAAMSSLQMANETTTRLLGDVESVDLAEALTKLSNQQVGYQAALKGSATVLQTSLLDFLR